jgi:4-amino-4-deoxy-L-arabinose transferase-like glycosyltransferase
MVVSACGRDCQHRYRIADGPVEAQLIAPPAAASRRQTLALVGLLALAFVVFAIPAGRRPFWSSDEARFAILAQDILDQGRWLVPHLRGDLYLNKPQLYFWSIALVSLIAGRVTELTAAIPSVLSAVATVGGVVAIGRRLWGPHIGLLAGLVLVATLPFYAFSHAVLSDVMMTAFMTWALYFLLRAQTGDDDARWPLLAFYGCIGAAVLAKGPAGLAALAAGAVATAVTRGPAALTRLKPVYGVAVLAAAGIVWFAPYLVQSQGRFVSRVLVGHYTPWYLEGGLLPRLGQFASILGNFLPWTALLVAAATWWPGRPDAGRRWIGAATLSLALILGLSGHQRARYLLPIYPGLALLVAEFAGRAGGTRSTRFGAWVFATVAVAAAIGAPFLPGYVTGDDRAYLPTGALELGAIVVLVLGAALSQVLGERRGSFAAGTVGAALLICAVMVLEGVTYPARYTRDNDLRPLAAAAARHAPARAAVIAYPDSRLSLDFYLDQPVVEAATPQLAAALLAKAPSAVVTSRSHWATLAPHLPASARVVAAGRAGGREYVVVVP